MTVKKILVTGGGGFIGSHLAQYLYLIGNNVRIADVKCGRNADLTLARNRLGWEPKISLEQGLASTYEWIKKQILIDRTERDFTNDVIIQE